MNLAKTISLLFLAFSSILFVDAQSPQQKVEIHRCNTTIQYHEERMQYDKVYEQHIRSHRQHIEQKLHARNINCSGGPVKIPVAVHFDNGVVPAGQEDCAIDLVIDQLASLNNELQGNDPQNDSYSSFQNCFPGSPVIGNSCIELILASYKHPASSGLEEGEFAVTFGLINFSNTLNADSYVPFENTWSGYLNIYVTDLPDFLLGQSAGIPGQFNGEGVVIDACTFGTGNIDCTGMSSSASCISIYDEGNTLTHEVGHYLGLFHIWGDNFRCTGAQDHIEDTPNMAATYSGYTDCSMDICTELPESCGSKDMFMNYMSYAADACMYMFTEDQANLMQMTAINAGFTSETPLQCTSSEVPEARFTWSPNPCILCPGENMIQFFDESTADPHNWYWTFTGNGLDKSFSNEQNPKLTVLETGIILVSLIVENQLAESSTYEMSIPVQVLEENNPFCEKCEFKLLMFDSYGDGWNGAYIDIFIDGQESFEFHFQQGDSIMHNFSGIEGKQLDVAFNGGSWDSEISFKILDPLGQEIFNQGSNPGEGILFTTNMQCTLSSCEDGIMNGNETGVDCGGDCPSCSSCGQIFSDSGGPYENYGNSENKTWTFCPDTTSEAVGLNFSFFELEKHKSCNFDKLSIYNGSGTEQLLGEFCGNELPPLLYSTANNGCLTAVFTSDISINKGGWLADIECKPRCTLVSTTEDHVEGSLRFAIDCALPGDTIVFAAELAGDSIVLIDSLLIEKEITIIDHSESITVLSENTINKALVIIAPSGILSWEGLILEGDSDEDMPLIKNSGQLLLKNTCIIDHAGANSVGTLINNAFIEIDGNVDIEKVSP